jgi:hypothetical protein
MKKLLLLAAILVSINCVSQKMTAKDSVATDSMRNLLSSAVFKNENILSAIDKAKSNMSFKDYSEGERYITFFIQLLQQAWLEDKNHIKIK